MFGMPQCRGSPMPAADCDGEEALYSCRICFEDAKPSELISPCKCKGTLKWVHQGCLHRWQANVARLGGKRDERATVCGVCRSAYTSLPPQAALHVARKLWAASRGLLGAALISLAALCLSGPPALHLALLLLLLLGSRSQSLLAVLLLVVGGVVGSLYARGLRLVVRGAGDGELRFGLALIRHGAPIEGLQAGSLLVAHGAALQGGMFERSVVLVTEKSARGARGVMLTQPMETADSALWAQHQPLAEAARSSSSSSSSSSAHSAAIRHFLGGPLEGEVRAGAWGVVAAAELADVVATPAQLLWEVLAGSTRARWF
ncbi:hypothetical protein OEZ85_000452 [Tetradesmus obliquus]|uniref:RING-CH-type domain-containing protein n=1 Tax=Tetradesmus obliquus TaxID=3088 RepID=A0ABY8UI52_TETOB|nr:hypothetical protein OEZ85_000452 [Tetradesmus obliquus]